MKSAKANREQTQQACLPERIRPELNVEKWSIWRPGNARTGPKERILEREIGLPDGNRVAAKLTVKPMVDGNPTTKDQRVYYALVKHWEERGRSADFTPFSLQRLARLLRMPWGQSTRESLNGSLFRLRGTLFIWEQAFEDKTTGRVLSRLDTFHLLSDLKIVRIKDEGKVNREVGYFRFHEQILKNLLANHTKPVLIDVVLSFRSEIAQILYTHLDLILSDKTSYERRTKELFEDLGLEGKAYKHLSDRRRILDRALPELQGKPLTTGTITTAKLEPTKDGRDFKLVVRKGKAKAEATLPLSNVIPLPLPSSDQEEPSEAEELVRHFHKVFHGVDECYPTAKALDQAATLIARHGAEKARHIIEVARREAQKTGHKIATFGGIMQYETPALADFEQKRHDRERQRAAERAAEAKRRAEAEREAKERAETAEFDEQWGRWNESERAAFQAEALDQAEKYGLKFIATRYCQQADKTSPAALLHLRTILITHYRETRQG